MPADAGLLTADARRAVLDAFQRVLSLEVQHLSRWPELVWQQCYNRLQWEGDPVRGWLDPWRIDRSGGSGLPWIRTRTPLRESAGLIRTLAGHDGAVRACAVAPDGSYVVSAGGYDHTLKTWDPSTGVVLRTLVGHDEGVRDCAVSPDGSNIVSASADHTLKVWDPSTGAELRTLAGHRDSVLGCAIAPDDSYVVSASADGTLKMWDQASGQELRTLEGHTDEVRSCAVAPDGSFLVSASKDMTLRLWDPATGAEVRILEDYRLGPDQDYDTGNPPYGRDCAVAADGSYVVSVFWELSLTLSDPAGGGELRKLKGQRRSRVAGELATSPELEGCAVAPDGSYVVAAHEDNTLRLWDPTTGEEHRPLEGHAGGVRGCAVTPDGAFVVSASGDGTLKIWNPSPEREVTSREGHSDTVSDCAVAPDGSYVVSAGREELKLWDPLTGEDLRVLDGFPHKPVACAISPDGTYMVSAGSGGLVLWDPSTALLLDPRKVSREQLIVQLRAQASQGLRAVLGEHFHEPGVGGVACAVSPDGSFVVAALDDVLLLWDAASLRTWDPATLRDVHTAVEPIRTLEGHTERVSDCAVAPDTSYIVSASWDTTVRLWDPASGLELRTLDGHSDAVEACVVAPDGSFLVSGSHDHTVKLWDPVSGREIRTLVGHTDPVLDCAVAPDARYVVSGSVDKTLRLWDAETGQALRTFPLPGAVWCVAFHPLMPLIVCGDRGGTVYFLDLVGVEYGPIIVTSVDHGEGPTLRCPRCWREHRVDYEWLGAVVACPTPTCDLTLRPNPFMAGNRPGST